MDAREKLATWNAIRELCIAIIRLPSTSCSVEIFKRATDLEDKLDNAEKLLPLFESGPPDQSSPWKA